MGVKEKPGSPAELIFQPFVREDLYGTCGCSPLSTCEKLRLYALAIFLAPLRITFSIVLLMIFYLNLKASHYFCFYGATRYPLLVGRFLTRVCLGVLGFLRISRQTHTAESKEDDRYPTLIISNHGTYSLHRGAARG